MQRPAELRDEPQTELKEKNELEETRVNQLAADRRCAHVGCPLVPLRSVDQPVQFQTSAYADHAISEQLRGRRMGPNC